MTSTDTSEPFALHLSIRIRGVAAVFGINEVRKD